MAQIAPKDGDFFEGVLLETFRDYEVSRPRVTPVEGLLRSLKVEFPRGLREANPIGTLFRANVFVRQKHYSNGAPKGPLYLRADTGTIIKIAEPTTDVIEIARQKRGTISGRAYEYFVSRSAQDALQKKLYELRAIVYSSAKETLRAKDTESVRRERSKLIGDYARLRSEGHCEACQKPAPFIRRNEDPYLEVHHIDSLADGGADHPTNVAAVCPNCHARVTHGKDGSNYNLQIKRQIALIEDNLSKYSSEE